MARGCKPVLLRLLEHCLPAASSGFHIFQLCRWHKSFPKSGIESPVVFTPFCSGAGIVANLGLLGYFKYADFLIENINTAFDVGLNLPQILLPLGISFFTFTQIAYLVDSYRGKPRNTIFSTTRCLLPSFLT